jgi:hypothetical protein
LKRRRERKNLSGEMSLPAWKGRAWKARTKTSRSHHPRRESCILTLRIESGAIGLAFFMFDCARVKRLIYRRTRTG